MTTTITLATVAHAISQLSISGVSVQDVHNVSLSLGEIDHVLVLRADDYITNLTITAAELSKQNLDVAYDLHYIYYHCAIGGDLFDVYSGLIDKIALIVVAFAQNDTLAGAVDNIVLSIDHVGPVSDNSGNAFHGAEFTVHILQFLEV